MNSTFWLNKVMKTVYTDAISEFWVGLSSTLPTQDGAGVSEPTGNNYARVKVQNFTPPNLGTVKNAEALEFNRSTGVWFDSDNKARYWVLFDGSDSSANLLSSGELDEAKTIESNTSITILAETLSITLTDFMPAG